MQATRTGFKDSVVLTRPPAKDQAVWRFPLKNTGLTAAELGDGRIAFTDADGKQVAVSAPALMWDAQRDKTTGDPLRTAPVTTEVVTGKNGAQEIRLIPQAGFLTDSQTVYPVTVDPSTSLGQLNDHWVSKDMRTGATATYNSSVSPAEIRAGYYAGGYTKHYGYLHFDSSPISAQYVNSAKLNLYQHSAITTCSGGGTHIYGLTNGFNDSTTWASRPIAATTVTSMLGGCGTGWYGYDVVNLVKGWAGGTTANYGMQLRAGDDAQTFSFWRFHGQNAANAAYVPSLAVNWNRPPAAPSNFSPLGGAVTASKNPQLSAQVSDADGGTVRAQFVLRTYPGGALVHNGDSGSAVASQGRSEWTVPTALADGEYAWQARAHDGIDGYSAYAPADAMQHRFRVDSTPPPAPAVTSPQTADGGWTSTGDVTVTFTDAALDVQGFYYRVDDGNEVPAAATASGSGTAGSAALTGLPVGTHTVRVRAYDQVSSSPTTAFTFTVRGAASLTQPVAGDQLSGLSPLTAAGPAAATKVTVKMSYWTSLLTRRRGIQYTVVLTSVTRDGAPVTFPTATDRSGGMAQLPAGLVWNARQDAAGRSGAQVWAEFTDDNGTILATTPKNSISVDPNARAAATEPIGPGELNLLTGGFTITGDDASAPAHGTELSVTRTFDSRDYGITGTPGYTPDGQTVPDVFGPGWRSALPGGQDSGYRQAHDDGAAVTLVTDDGGEHVYRRTATSPETFTPTGPAALDAATLKTVPNPTTGKQLALTDLDGTVTLFTSLGASGAATSDGPHRYEVTSVNTTGDNQTTRFAYDSNSNGRVTTVHAPAPAGITCPSPTQPTLPWNTGCRGLLLGYTTVTTPTGATESRLATVTLKTGPGTTAPDQTAIACYAYAADGRLHQAWDPRVGAGTTCGQPVEPVAYTYDSDGRLATVTPPGLAAWEMTYDTSRRLTAAAQNSPQGRLTSTIKYAAPIGATTGDHHPDLSTRTAWGQTRAVPHTAVAVFGPGDTIPADGDSTTPWTDADITVLDADGRAVNTASYSGTGQRGWRITTTEYDTHGNAVRELTAGNRDTALHPTADQTAALGLPADSASRARALDTTHHYSADGLDLMATYGPLHQMTVTTSTGPQTVAGRVRTTHEYGTNDTSAHPNGVPTDSSTLLNNAPQHLLLGTTVDAAAGPNSPWPTTGAGYDPRTTRHRYAYTDAGGTVSDGWKHRTPIETTTSMNGTQSDLVRRSKLDPTAGAAVESRMPNDPNGTGAGTTRTVLYTAAANTADSACTSAAWAGLSCKTVPTQPTASGTPALVTTRYEYDHLLRAVTTTETSPTPGVPARITTTTYENNGHSPRVSRTVTTGGQGTPAPATTLTYHPNTGLSHQQKHDDGTAITTAYDTLGRPTAVTDADSNTSTTTYDSRGRVASTHDGRNTTAYTYDSPTERRGLVTATTNTALAGAGNDGGITGQHDPDGQLAAQTMPDGLTHALTRNPAGDTTHAAWSRNGTTLWTDSQTSNPHGQWRTHNGLGHAQTYTYDPAGRLTAADDATPTADGQPTCTRRQYTLDSNSNRTNRRTHTPATACGAAGTWTDSSHAYDTADRLLATGQNTGLAYDGYGRTTALPAATSGTSAATTIGYYNTDLVANQTSGDQTRSWQLDPAGRRRTATHTTPAGTTTATSHYDDPAGDNPAWTDEGDGTTASYTTGLDGDLVAVTTTGPSGSAVAFQHTNLHDDVVTTTSPGSNALTATQETDEYGNRTASQTGRYQWLGGKQRSSDSLGNLVLMGVRLYSPNLGRFLSVDPVVGGGDNSYAYPTDPVNMVDLDGRVWNFVGAAAGAACKRYCGSLARKAWGPAKKAGRWAGRKAYKHLTGPNGHLFGSGKAGNRKGWLNRGPVRTGWGWVGKRDSGHAVFRTSVGWAKHQQTSWFKRLVGHHHKDWMHR